MMGMKLKISTSIMVIMICLSYLLIINLSETSKAKDNDIYVSASYHGFSDGSAEKPYQTIQDAIEIAEEDDTIYIFGGLYQEDLIINKKLTIVGAIDEIDTVIDSRFDRRYLIEITADEVTIENITVQDSDGKTTSPIGALICLKSSNNRLVRNKIRNTDSYGIYVHSSSNDNLISYNTFNNTKEGVYITSSNTNDVTNNKVDNCSGYGIHIESSIKNNRVYGNFIENCSSGIYIVNSEKTNITNNNILTSDFYAIYVLQSDNSIVVNNNIVSNHGDGIYLSSNYCKIFNNTIEANRRGLVLINSNNEIFNNTFKLNNASGIYGESSSSNNRIFINYFINNGMSAKDIGNNLWYNQEEGNYWDDYSYSDVDGDGIGDEAYSDNGVLDLFPLGYFLKPPNKPTDPEPADQATGVGLRITLKVLLTDPDSETLDVYFYKADDDSLIKAILRNPVKNVQNDTTASCSFTLGFNTTFAWYVIVDDGLLQNRSNTFIFYTAKTPPSNDPPIVNAGGPYTAEIGEQINFDSSGCYDPDGDIDFYRWNFGDGSSEILEENPIHLYQNQGSFQVVLTIIDNNGTSATDITTANINPSTNRPPMAYITSEDNGFVDEEIQFLGSSSYDPDNDKLTFLWDFGDGQSSVIMNPIHKYESSGSYIVELTVSDGKQSDKTNFAININEKKSADTPGFEILLAMVSIALILFWKRKTNK
jgi:parallel beta-helix repeat protein